MYLSTSRGTGDAIRRTLPTETEEALSGLAVASSGAARRKKKMKRHSTLLVTSYGVRRGRDGEMSIR